MEVEEVHFGKGAPSEVPDHMEASLQEDILACPGDEHHTDLQTEHLRCKEEFFN